MYEDVPSGTPLHDELDQLAVSYPRASREVQDRAKSVEQALAQLNEALAPSVELAAKLRAHDERMVRTVNELKVRNQNLQTRNDNMARELKQANDENARLNDLLTSIRTESRNLQTQLDISQAERESLTKSLTDAVQQLDELRTHEKELTNEMALYETNWRRVQGRVKELEQQIASDRQENQMAREQYDREVTKRMMDQKAELERRHTKVLEEEREDHERKFRHAKTSFKDAINELGHQVKILENERNDWHAKYNQLAKEFEDRQRQMKAECEALLTRKFHEFVRDWMRRMSEQTSRHVPAQVPQLPRVENYAEQFFRDATDQSPSEASVHQENGHQHPGGAGNANGRKRALSNRETAARYVVDRVSGGQMDAPQQPRRPTQPE